MKRRKAFTNESLGLEELPDFDYTPEELKKLEELRSAWSKLRNPDDDEVEFDEAE